MTTRRYYVRITLRSEERDDHGCIVDGALDAETVSLVIHGPTDLQARSSAWAELGVMLAERHGARSAEVLARYRLVSSVQMPDAVWASEGFPCGS